jgi:hypothetical protein
VDNFRVLVTAICGALIILSAPTPGRAVTITSSDAITVSLSPLPSGPLFANIVDVTLQIATSDLFGPSEGFRARLFDSGNSLLASNTFSSGAVGLQVFGFGLIASSSVDNTGYVVIDQIVGSFDLTNILVAGQLTEFVSTQFEVTSATPLPAALPLFATGLGGLGLLGWRRKRRSAAFA